MRFLRWTVAIVVAALVVDFAVTNRDPVKIVLWPFADLAPPGYLAVLLPMLLGMIMGWFAAGWRSWRRRRAEKKTTV